MQGYDLEALDGLIRELDRAGPPPRRPGLGPLAAVVDLLLGARWPDARQSLLALRRVADVVGPAGPWPSEGVALEALAALLSSGAELPRALARGGRRRLELLGDDPGREREREQLERDLERRLRGVGDADEAGFALGLAAFRTDHYVRLATCEFLELSTLEQVGRQLALLADVCLEAAMRFVLGRLARNEGEPLVSGSEPCRLAALAMGKYGAQELNFCSDIDLVFIYTSDEGAAGGLSLHEFFSRACQQVTRILSEPGPEGLVFRVDLRLRPEGSRGPICNALAGAERYYETWGGPYDRLAWLKARPAAGDRALGEKMLRIMQPFVFPRSLRPEVVEQIQALYRRVAVEGSARDAARGGWNVKTGTGGIRHVEFLVQALQLLHGGKHPGLRERATLPALDRLLFLGLITETEHRRLAEAYELWRRIEHRLQLRDGRQTHRLPGSGPVREHVARHLGRSPDAFDAEIEQRRAEVQAIFDTLGSAGAPPAAAGGPAPLAVPSAPQAPALERLLHRSLGRQEREALLDRAGFAVPERAADQLELLASRPWGPLGRAPHPAAARVALPLLEEIVRSPDPDAALGHVAALALRHGPYHGLWELLDHNRSTLRLLTSLFGSSDHLARLFIDHPELMDLLLGAGHARAARDEAEMRAGLTARLEQLEPDDFEGRLNLLRRFRNEEALRIGLHDIAGALVDEAVWRQLSDLAQVILEQVYPLVWREAAGRYGAPRETGGGQARMAVLALGKLGGRELTYASDLDLIFIHSGGGNTTGGSGAEIDNTEFFARLAQRLIRALSLTLEEGRLYEVDTRLRPSGNQGTLVVSWPAFRGYHEKQAQLWERQTLIKVRAVAGDQALGQEIEQWVTAYVFGQVDPDVARQQLDQHRRRMEKELAGENRDFYNLKFGPGGLLDIDFIVQYLQLCHGWRLPSLRVRSSLEALPRLEQEHLIDSATASGLERGYRFLRRVENRLRIVRDRSAARLPRRAQGLEVMARRLGYRQRLEASPGQQLLEDYQETTGSIRAIYERILGR